MKKLIIILTIITLSVMAVGGAVIGSEALACFLGADSGMVHHNMMTESIGPQNHAPMFLGPCHDEVMASSDQGDDTRGELFQGERSQPNHIH